MTGPPVHEDTDMWEFLTSEHLISEADEADLKRMAGQHQFVGAFVAAGGVVILGVGVFTGNPFLMLGGSIIYFVGVSMYRYGTVLKIIYYVDAILDAIDPMEFSNDTIIVEDVESVTTSPTAISQSVLSASLTPHLCTLFMGYDPCKISGAIHTP